MVTFITTIVSGGGNTAGIEVPEDVVLSFGRGKRVPVVVTLGQHVYRSTVAPYKGPYMISLSAAHREAAGVAAGDEVEVTLEYDDQPRTVAVPDDLADALAGSGVRASFDALSPSARKAHVLAVESAKTAETRFRRVAAVVVKLGG